MDETFVDFCKAGNLIGIINLIDKNKINIHKNDEEGFILACFNGYLHIVEYLTNLYKINTDYKIINIHSRDEEGFRWACMRGYLHIVKYLLSIGSYFPNHEYVVLL